MATVAAVDSGLAAAGLVQDGGLEMRWGAFLMLARFRTVISAQPTSRPLGVRWNCRQSVDRRNASPEEA